MAKKSLDDARTKMLAVLQSLGPCRNEEAIAEFDRLHPDVNEAAAADYAHVAKVKLISECLARRKRAHAVDINQPDLFGGLSYGIIAIPVIKNGKIVDRIKKDFLDATDEEAQQWVDRKNHRREEGPKGRDSGEESILRMVRPYLSPGMTIREGMKLAALAAEATAKPA